MEPAGRPVENSRLAGAQLQQRQIYRFCPWLVGPVILVFYVSPAYWLVFNDIAGGIMRESKRQET